MIKFADSTKHSKQRISLWLIHDQKSISITRAVQETSSGAYITYQGSIVHVRGSKGREWNGNY